MILVRSVKVIDGTGKPAYSADVLIENKKISAIGYFPDKQADTVIDGLGYYLMPGFIDINTDADHTLSLFTNPNQKEFLLRGITTIIGGNCGSSLAPLLYGTLESIQKWTDINQINVNWNTMAEFFAIFGKKKLGVNFATLVGHSTIRRAIVHEDLRDLTDGEILIFKKILEDSLEEGALGMSTGLVYAHSNTVPYNEIKILAEVLKKHNAVYATHLRDEKEGLIDAIKETIKLAEETGVKTVISHLKAILGNENNFQFGLDLINKTKAEIFFEVYPSKFSVVPVYTLLPRWAQVGGLSFMLEQILDENIAGRITRELPPLQRDDLTIVSAVGNEYLVGKQIGDIAKNQGVTIPEALLRLMITTRLRAMVSYENVNQETMIGALAHSKALISPVGASFVADKMPIEEIIKKITSLPAEKYGLKNRGLIREGSFADLVLIKDILQPSAEIVIVNGKIVIKDGKYQDILAGEIIKKE